MARHWSDCTLSGILRKEYPPVPFVGSPRPSSSIMVFYCLELIKLADRFQGDVSTLFSISLQTFLKASDFSSMQKRLAAALILSVRRYFTYFMPSLA